MKTILLSLATLAGLMAAAAGTAQGAYYPQAPYPQGYQHGYYPAPPQVRACPEQVYVKVSGMVCDFCARALEKVFSTRNEVSGIRVDLDNGYVTVGMKPGQSLDDATVAGLVIDAGYNVTGINRGC